MEVAIGLQRKFSILLIGGPILKIPTRLLQLLERDRILHSAVLQALGEFRPWMELSGTPFFPEYTRHDPDHVERVLQTAAAILRDEAWPILTAADAAVLVVAGLLHDSAVHLTEGGFLQLINPEQAVLKPLLPNDRPWPILWEEYLSLARRFNARELTNLFGNLQPVRQPAPDPRDWTLRDRLLIGDFLRRHHHRLAHEIALWGVPGNSGGEPLRLNLEKDFADLAGLVARSHGMPLRELLDPLRDTYDLRQYRGVHAICLMVLLRISDYLQVDADRAPRQLLQVKRLWSPFSLGKWKEHHAVRDVRTTHDDPEAIFVDALPSDVDRYLGLKDLLGDFQKELDVSWAVLGEIYGRWEELKGLGLTSRRVRSTIDDEGSFGRSVEYVPRRASFEAASGDLIPLLVNPLYGDRPEIGVRELLQNAVDAVRELWLYSGNPRGNMEEGEPPEITVDLKEDDEKNHWLVVEDQGIGMTVDTICSYFLKVGASFRRSDLWRKNFEGEEGKALVLRSGRFGVGALAAFLLGEELEVTTRHVDSDVGVSFKARLDTDNIELRHCCRPIGTTIRIKLSVKARKVLAKESSWDWYCLSRPRVVRWDRRVIAQRYALPNPKASLPNGWRRIFMSDYEDVQWTYSEAPALVCNGIRVRSESLEALLVMDNLSIRTPNLSIFDADGKLPLNLERTALTQGLPFKDELLEDVLRDFFSFAVLAVPRNRLGEMAPKYLGLQQSAGSAWFHLPDGMGIVTGRNLQVARKDQPVVVVPFAEAWGLVDQAYGSTRSPVIRLNLDTTVRVMNNWIRRILGSEPYFLWKYLNPKGVRLVIRKDWGVRLREGGPGQRLPHWLMSRIQKEKDLLDWEVWAYRSCPTPSVDFYNSFRNIALSSEDLPVVLVEIYPGSSADNVAATQIDLLWQKYIGRPVIPYEWKERRRVLKHTFAELREYIETHKTSTVQMR